MTDQQTVRADTEVKVTRKETVDLILESLKLNRTGVLITNLTPGGAVVSFDVLEAGLSLDTGTLTHDAGNPGTWFGSTDAPDRETELLVEIEAVIAGSPR